MEWGLFYLNLDVLWTDFPLKLEICYKMKPY